MTDHYEEWRDFYAEKVRSWMSPEELRAECGKLQTVDNPSPEVLLVHAMHALEELQVEVERLRRGPNPAITHCHDCGKEPDLWRCTVCGRVGTVGRCCGEETRERANTEHLLAEYECLRDEVERLRADRDSWEQQASDRVADWHAEHLRAERLAEALKDIRSLSSINSAMNPSPLALTVLLGDIHHIADAALAKENRNDQ